MLFRSRSAGKFQERASVRTWLLGIAKHIVMDALRAQYRSSNNEQSVPDLEHYETADPTPGPYELTLASQKGAQLVACFDALSPDHRECLHLAFVEGLTLGEIASVVNAPSNTVGTRIHHAKHKLKACLETRLGVGEVV